jgi:alpha-beta hydrolase superfamily lysophospholipase
MITTNTIPARAAIGATIAAICFAVAACGSERDTVPDQNSPHATLHAAQRAAADDVAALVEHRKAALTQEMGRPQHAVADDVEKWIEQRKSTLGKH